MKKKILSALLTVCLLGSLAACSGEKEQQTTTPADGTTQLTPGTTAPEDKPEPEPTTDPGETGDPDAGEQSDCQRLTDAVLKAPSIAEIATMQVSDESMLSDVMNYDLPLFTEYSVVTHLMSVHLIEITVAKPAEGKKQDALDMLETRKQALIDTVAFYPEQMENAEKTVVGSKGDYVYLLCGPDSEEMQKTLLEAIGN